jgi:predicted CXXCH cytochrome family protein
MHPRSSVSGIAPRMRLLTACSGIAVLMLAGCQPSGDVAPESATAASVAPVFVGGHVCATCHEEQVRAWQGSHHQLAMQPVGAGAVLGNFDDAQFVHEGVTTRFFRRDGSYWVNTEDANGLPRDFPVRFTFGVDPLQQYLLELDDGRYQALTIAWDSRAVEQGGQRWFHLIPDTADHTDPLHWTGIYANWNSSCAECHSTNLAKNFDAAAGTFATTWSSDNVDCEACHGPGSNHAAAPTSSPMALAANVRAWVFNDGTPIAQRSPPVTESAEVEVCAQCHSRRTQFGDRHEPGDPLLDAFRPALLDAGLYHADGQILEEVYEYGSFVQSRMHAAGVTCSDCHDPHTARLRADGNAVCAQCHLPSTFDTPEHHRHAAATSGSACVDCHMHERTYMVVDPRRDHSFRVPRPDLSVSLGTPNACNACHDDRSAQWAADEVAQWFPDGRGGSFHYANALHAGRQWAADRKPLLTQVIDDAASPPIVRATAIALLANQFDRDTIDVLRRTLLDAAPLVRLAALEELANAPLSSRVELAQRFLTDSTATLRMAAARVLVPAREQLDEQRRRDLDAALAEYVAAQQFNADRADGLLNLGNLEAEMGRLAEAERSFRLALERQREFSATYVNLADLYRQLGREAEAEQVLRSGLEINPSDPGLLHALGLSLVRGGRSDDALTMLRRAAEQGADDPLYRYVYGVALHSLGQRNAALEVLRAAHERFPGHAPTLIALATMYRDGGNLDQARDYAGRLFELSPSDPGAQALLRELEQQR